MAQRRIIPIQGNSSSDEESVRPRFAGHPEFDRTHWARNAAFWWLALAPLLVLVQSLASTLSPNDFWGHVATGRLVAQSGIPTTNVFSWGAPLGRPYPYPSWGAAWLMFATLKNFGLTGIVAIRALCAAGTWAILIAVAWRRVRRVAPETELVRLAQIIAFVAVLAFGMAGTNLDARPQMFALPLFALAIFLLLELPERVRSNSTVLSFVFIGTVLWANAHGSFFLAVAIPLGALVGETVRKALGKRGERSGASLSPSQLKFLAAWAAVATVATFINPRGVHVWDYVFTLTANRTVQQFIYEWQAPRFGEGPGTVFFGGAALLCALVFLVNNKNENDQARCGVRAGEALILLALFVLGCRSLRSVLWFALLFIPLASAVGALYFASRAAKESIRPRFAGHPEFDRTPSKHLGIKAVCGALALCAILGWPPIKARLPLPQSFSSRYAPSPEGKVSFVLDRSTPVEAVEYLKKNPPRRLWNDMGQGAYLAYALPAGTARCDWRIELFSESFWLEYLKLSQGPPDAAAQLEKMGIRDVLCDRDAQRGLVARLRRARKWRERDFGQSVLFSKIVQ